MSLYSMGIFIGSGLALLVGGTVVQAMTQVPTIDLPVFGTVASWRLTFLIVGLPGLLIAAWVATLREPARRDLLLDREGRPSALTMRQVVEQGRARWQSIIVFRSRWSSSRCARTASFGHLSAAGFTVGRRARRAVDWAS